MNSRQMQDALVVLKHATSRHDSVKVDSRSSVPIAGPAGLDLSGSTKSLTAAADFSDAVGLAAALDFGADRGAWEWLWTDASFARNRSRTNRLYSDQSNSDLHRSLDRRTISLPSWRHFDPSGEMEQLMQWASDGGNVLPPFVLMLNDVDPQELLSAFEAEVCGSKSFDDREFADSRLMNASRDARLLQFFSGRQAVPTLGHPGSASFAVLQDMLRNNRTLVVPVASDAFRQSRRPDAMAPMKGATSWLVSTAHSPWRDRLAHSVRNLFLISPSPLPTTVVAPFGDAVLDHPGMRRAVLRIDGASSPARRQMAGQESTEVKAPTTVATSRVERIPTRRQTAKPGSTRKRTARARISDSVARQNGAATNRSRFDDLAQTVEAKSVAVEPAQKIDRGSSSVGDCFGFPAESLQRERELVGLAKPSRSVKAWFDIYSQVGKRPLYLWKWCVHGADLTTIPAVAPEWRRHVCDTKVLSIMLCVLLDDVADEQGNERLLEALMLIVERQLMPDMSQFSAKDRKTAEVTLKLSQIYENRVQQYPLYEVYRRLLQFDLMQYFNTMRYSCLLNENLHLLNVTEHELYLPHAMHMMSFSTLDLMCTPSFQVHELGKYREAIWHAQCMGRVGNLLSTWEREIGQTDFTSGVFARAVIQGDLRVDQLRINEAPAIEAAIIGGGHEQHFLKTWFDHRERLRNKVEQIQSIDMHDFVERQERFFQMHLACRGAI